MATEPFYCGHVMADEEHSTAFARNALHFSEALALKGCIPNCEDFIDQQDLRLQVGCHSESQTNVHAAAVAFHWSIQEFLDLGESDDFVELPADLCTRHSENGAIEKDVFPAGEFGVKAGPDFQQTRHPATNADATFRWLGNSAKDFQQSGFSRAVAANDAHNVALPDL